MKESFYNNLKTLVGTPEKCSFLLVVSGGGDSVVMTHLFYSCGLPFAIAHCNFHLRGDDSNEDMRFVQQLAANYGVQLFVKEFDTLSIQKNSGKSVEMVARDLRYQWFEEVGQPFDFIVTAHHANDNAETLLLNLCRGTGLKGLAGIPARNGKYLRPLLPFPSDELRRYTTRHHLSFRTDRTNFSEQYQRNKIRLAVLPKLTEINPDLIRTFSRNADHFRHQYDFYQRQLAAFEREMVIHEDETVRISIPKLSENPD
ncbi:MAG: tRNA lysidine(34) synthetase TilS, partial [Bacteroidales bacterium]|nr:tRNA lysidine(34) synthetase TilS [Bacteroidales bacterium]